MYGYRSISVQLHANVFYVDSEANGSDRSSDGEFTWTVEEETAVRRKLDRVIVPLTTFLYLLCFLDRYETCSKATKSSLTCFSESTLAMHVSRVWVST